MIICSAINGGVCEPPFKSRTSFNDWDSCMRMGYADSIEIMNLMGEEYVNKKQIYIRFTCKETKEQKV